MKPLIIILIPLVQLCTLSSSVFAQDYPDTLILYDTDFKFAEGVYPDFESVRYNAPIPKSRILSDYSYSDKDFFERVLNQSKFYYFDNVGNKIEAKSKDVWGYSRNGFLYVRIDNGFYRITMVGSICHFIAYRTYENYNYPYNAYSNYPHSTRPPSTTTEMEQYLLDFKTGNIIEYSVEGVEVLLMSDTEMYDEYMSLSRKKKKQLKFVYIRRFNERNPLFLIKK